MTIIVDAGPLVALPDLDDVARAPVRPYLLQAREELIIRAPVTAEVDYLLGRRFGQRARQAFLLDLANGRFRVECLLAMEYEMVRQLDSRYADLDVGLADLSVVVLARRFGTRRILTFDERHFRTLRPLDGGTFTLLPSDERGPGR